MSSAMNTIGFIQGRLCDQVDGKIQAFPWSDWEAEFSVAASIDLHLMEWTLDQDRLYENPLMTSDGQFRIRSLCQQYRIEIPSLTGDCFMQAPFWKAESQAKVGLKADFLAICEACANIGTRMVVVPLVDNGRLEDMVQEDELVSFLLDQMDVLTKLEVKVVFESDFAPSELQRFINRLPDGQFGINYDIGNSAALGFDPVEEFAAYGPRIMNVHVKDRILGGTTVPLTSGSADFKTIFAELAKISYQGNCILQTARAEDADHAGVLARYRDMTVHWMQESGLA
jgi:L-ribulose-5-phosphate 3-epimerase